MSTPDPSVADSEAVDGHTEGDLQNDHGKLSFSESAELNHRLCPRLAVEIDRVRMGFVLMISNDELTICNNSNLFVNRRQNSSLEVV